MHCSTYIVDSSAHECITTLEATVISFLIKSSAKSIEVVIAGKFVEALILLIINYICENNFCDQSSRRMLE